jgi:hypothetical protein
MRGLDVRGREDAFGGDVVERNRRSQPADDERGLARPVTAFDLVGDLADVQPRHPRSLGVEHVLHGCRCGLVSV